MVLAVTSGPTQRLLANVLVDSGGGVQLLIADGTLLRPFLSRIFLKDFEEAYGVPSRLHRAKRGSPEAISFAITYLKTSVGFDVLVLSP